MTKSTAALLFGLLAGVTLPWASPRTESATRGAARSTPRQWHRPTHRQPPPEQIAPADRTPGTAGDTNLSNRLSRHRGTLQPPSVDPGIHVPIPPQSQGTMPVIPPPGTPGGDQRVVPK